MQLDYLTGKHMANQGYDLQQNIAKYGIIIISLF